MSTTLQIVFNSPHGFARNSKPQLRGLRLGCGGREPFFPSILFAAFLAVASRRRLFASHSECRVLLIHVHRRSFMSAEMLLKHGIGIGLRRQ
jgi:hypothetical protein